MILLLMFLLGVFTGIINIVSAGGALLTLPILIFIGLPPTVANGTNRIASFFQNTIAMYLLSKRKLINWKRSLMLSVPITIIAIFGSIYAIHVPEEVFNIVLAIVLISVTLLLIIRPQDLIEIKNKKLFIGIMIFIVGFYAGFLQAGVGFLIILMLTITYKDLTLKETHGIKVVINNIYLSVTILIFIINNQYNMLFALLLSLGSVLGSLIGSYLIIKLSEKLLHIIMITLMVGLSIGFLIAR